MVALPETLAIPGVATDLPVRRSRRARRLSLRVDPRLPAGAELVVPRGVAAAQARRFADSRAAWLRGALARLPAAQPFADGAEVPYRGTVHTIRASPGAGPGDPRGPVVRDGEAALLWVRGPAESLPRRLTDWFKARARERLDEAVADRCARLAELRPAAPQPKGVQIRDTRSRWGSCSAQRRLSFSWRLILAPDFVLAYLAAHEVAHLAEMNHGPAFWQLCDSLCGQRDQAEAWLKAYGPALHRYG